MEEISDKADNSEALIEKEIGVKMLFGKDIESLPAPADDLQTFLSGIEALERVNALMNMDAQIVNGGRISPVVAGQHAGALSEFANEIAVIGKAAFRADLLQARLSGSHHLQSGVKADLIDP